MADRTKSPEPGLSRVRSVVAGLALAGSISLEAAATRLGISRRTLQRRLNRHGVNFWTLVEERRFEIAAALLRETDLKVQEIAARMGYSTPSGFARAFAKWAGLSPTRFRRVPKKPEPRNVRLARNGQKDRT